MSKLTGKVAVVTGASKGIGAAMAWDPVTTAPKPGARGQADAINRFVQRFREEALNQPF